MRNREIRHEGALSVMMAAGAVKSKRSSPRSPQAEAKLNLWIVLVGVLIVAGVLVKVAQKLL